MTEAGPDAEPLAKGEVRETLLEHRPFTAHLATHRPAAMATVWGPVQGRQLSSLSEERATDELCWHAVACGLTSLLAAITLLSPSAPAPSPLCPTAAYNALYTKDTVLLIFIPC